MAKFTNVINSWLILHEIYFYKSIDPFTDKTFYVGDTKCAKSAVASELASDQRLASA